MDKKKWVVIGAVVLVLVSLAIGILPFIRETMENKKAFKKGFEWMEKEKKWNEQGRVLERDKRAGEQ